MRFLGERSPKYIYGTFLREYTAFITFSSVHPTLSSDYEIRIKYKYNIVDSF